jgi:rhodanese-related sulfurtransferase
MKCSKEDILTWQKQGSKLGLIDIREFYETPEIESKEVEHVPMGELLEYRFDNEITYVLICNSGSRATAAVMEIMRLNSKVNIYSLVGGAEAYLS